MTNQEGSDPLAFLKEADTKETFRQKAVRKFKEDPLIPTFFALTVAALCGGLRAMSRGESLNSNRFMRARIVAQSGCIAALAYAGYNGRLLKDPTGPKGPRK